MPFPLVCTLLAKKFKNNFYFVLYQCVRRENKFPPPPPNEDFFKSQ